MSDHCRLHAKISIKEAAKNLEDGRGAQQPAPVRLFDGHGQIEGVRLGNDGHAHGHPTSEEITMFELFWAPDL